MKLDRGSSPEAARRSHLQRVGFNVRNLEPEDVDLDLLSDAPAIGAIGPSESDEAPHEPNLSEALEALYGPAIYVPTSMGRSAERVFARTIADARSRKEQPFVVVTNGLFRSTEGAFRAAGAAIELVPCAGPGTADVDIEALESRLAKGDVDVVCLEPANNGHCGFALAIENVRKASALARKHGAMLVLDACRVMSNAAALSKDVLRTTQEMCAAADAYTASCAKEAFVAVGGFVAVRDLGLAKKIASACFQQGIGLEPLRIRRELVRGLERTLREPDVFARRHAALKSLGERMRGLPVVEPIGAHAVFVRLESIARPGCAHPLEELEALLFQSSGVRARAFKEHDKSLLRLTWPIGYDVTTADLDRIAAGVRTMFDRASAAPKLREQPNSPHLAMYNIRYVED
jgi:tryptophanase